jgi:predicted nucleotidyltransferase component of viral defense system
MREPIRNIGASVWARLQNISRQRHQTFQQVLTHYVLERLLYRLSQTKYRDRFALKGAMLITKWFADPLRPTQDLDLLVFRRCRRGQYGDNVPGNLRRAV